MTTGIPESPADYESLHTLSPEEANITNFRTFRKSKYIYLNRKSNTFLSGLVTLFTDYTIH
jgi:hypothetical protein